MSHPREGAPDTYHADPLSATSAPYSFSARSTTRDWRGKPLKENERRRRTRWPIAGREGSVRDEAKCRAG